MRGEPDFDQELDHLQRRLPAWLRATIEAARRPDAAWARVPLSLVLIAGGTVGFLPILGFWMIPLGLALLALDLPFLRGPLARVIAWINRKLA